MPAQVRLFGAAAICSGPAERPFGTDRPSQLLALLACRQTWVGREELAEMLWPERPTAGARNNVRVCLMRARRWAVDPPLEVHADRLRWLPDSDLRRFCDALASRDIDLALQLNTAPLLQGMETSLPEPAAEWLAFERQRVDRSWRDIAAIRLHDAAAAPADTAALAKRLLERDPDDETALLALADARRRMGDIGRAQRALDEHARRLEAQLGLDPEGTLRRLARTTVGPAHASAGDGPDFVGRRLELSQVDSLLQQEGCRILTITGPGGIGKSRLARAALHRLQPRFERAAWVELTDVAAAAQVPARAAAALGWTLAGKADGWTDLAAQAGSASLLLVLDNTEHLAGLDAAVAALVGCCPRLKLLNTARRRLAIDGEWLLPLDGLPLPDADETDPEVLRSNDAVRLFEARAHALSPGFDLAAEAPGVVRLLHAVEGMPLAIELAASWRRVLDSVQIADAMLGSFDLLEAPQASPRRDRSLRASFDHSWSLLGAAERASLARLAVLPGAFGVAMASRVADCRLPMLGVLVERSLLRADGAGRFSLHPLVRQCAAEKAAAGACDSEAQAERHLAYMKHWLAGFDEWRGAQVSAGLREIEVELPHVRAAWQRALALRRADFVVRTAHVLGAFYLHRGLWHEGLQAMEAAARTFEGSSATAHQATSGLRPAVFALGAARRAHLYQFGQLLYRCGRFAAARIAAERSLALVREHADSRLLVDDLNLVGSCLQEEGDFDRARSLLEEGLAVARRAGRERDIGRLLGNRALLEKRTGNFDAARAMYEESIALQRSADNPEGMIIQSNNLANLLGIGGQWERALQLFADTLALCDRTGMAAHRPLLLLNLGRACHQLGRADDARRWWEQAAAAARQAGRTAIEGVVFLGQGELALDEHRLDDAREWILRACGLAAAQGQVQQWCCLYIHARWLAASGEPASAAALLRRVLAEPALATDHADARRLLQGLGEVEIDAAAAAIAAQPLAELFARVGGR